MSILKRGRSKFWYVQFQFKGKTYVKSSRTTSKKAAEQIEREILEGFGVPFWALTHVFGRDDMYWYRLAAAVGRNSIAGTTVKRPERLPADLLADEKHTKHCGDKVYAAVTAGRDCILGAAMCRGADAAALSQGYGVFAAEAHNLDPDYRPETVNTDGWGATKIAWKTLFPKIVIIQCFLHAFIKVRDRCKKWGDLFTQIGTAVWDAYRAPNKRAFSQRIRRLREWAQETLDEGVVLDKLLALCEKAPLFARAYDHPSAHRAIGPSGQQHGRPIDALARSLSV